jgi:uncharacterized membrane protein YgcG
MKLLKGHHFGKSNSGGGRGFNDSGIDHFKKGTSLWNETKQNVGDNKDENVDEPAIVIYKQENMDLSTFGIGPEFKKIFKAAFERCQIISDKKDATKFYEEGLDLLKKKKIPVFIVRDFNTTGLFGDPFDPRSNFYRLLVAEGSSSQTGRGGGSHGHGQKAPFARSKLRTVYYYSNVKDGIQGTDHKDLFIGKTILNEWKGSDNKRRQHVGYYGNVNKELLDEKDQPIPLFGDQIPSQIKRKDDKTGLDMYILGSNLPANWRDSAIRHTLNKFYASIEHGLLKVGIKGSNNVLEYIDKGSIDSYVDSKNSNSKHYLKALRDPLNGTPFMKIIKHLGEVKLYISMHEGGTQKIDLMRRPRMRILTYDRPTLSNYSGVMIVDDINGNENMRLLEDPEHKKLERWREVEHFGEDSSIIKDLEVFIDDTLNGLRQEQAKEPFTLPGLGKIFPDMETDGNKGEDSGEDKEIDKTNPPELIKIKVSEKLTMGSLNISSRLALGKGSSGRGGGGSGSGGGSGGGQGGSGGSDEGGGVISHNDINIRTFNIGNDNGYQKYKTVLKVKNNCEGWLGYIAHGIDNVNEPVKISDFKMHNSGSSKDVTQLNQNRIRLGELKKGDTLEYEFTTDMKVKTALVTEN